MLAILCDTPLDADGRDAKRLDDLDLFAKTIANKLRGEHAKGSAIINTMRKDGEDADEIAPHPLFLDDTDELIEGGAIWDEG